MQDHDSLTPEELTFKCASEAQPTEEMLRDLRFAWRAVKHVKSNAITIAKDERLLGMGSGQPNRVKSTEIALEKVCSVHTERVHICGLVALVPAIWDRHLLGKPVEQPRAVLCRRGRMSRALFLPAMHSSLLRGATP